MTNHSATGAVRRAGLALCTLAVFVLGARTSFADPPPKPYFVVINDSTRTISGKFRVQYYPSGFGTGSSPETVVLEGSIGPRGSLRRNLPDQIARAKESDARTARIVGAGFSNGDLIVNGGSFRFPLLIGFVNSTAALGSMGSVTVQHWVEHPTSGDPEHVTMIVTFPPMVQ
jgi:hypothetical protein